jgi:hypothetical protein
MQPSVPSTPASRRKSTTKLSNDLTIPSQPQFISDDDESKRKTDFKETVQDESMLDEEPAIVQHPKASSSSRQI